MTTRDSKEHIKTVELSFNINLLSANDKNELPFS